MIIPINDEYRISSDKDNWMIDKSSVVKGEVIWTHIKYFMHLESVVNALAELMLKTSDAHNLTEALEVNRKVCKELTDALSPTYKVILK